MAESDALKGDLQMKHRTHAKTTPKTYLKTFLFFNFGGIGFFRFFGLLDFVNSMEKARKPPRSG